MICLDSITTGNRIATTSRGIAARRILMIKKPVRRHYRGHSRLHDDPGAASAR